MLSERDSAGKAAAAGVGDVFEPRAGEPGAPEDDPEWTALLGYLLKARGFDFHGYKPASLARRIRKRMDTVGVESFGTYQAYLEIHPKEFALLFNIILINVTGFFRDPAAWEAVRTAALRQIVGGKGPDEPIRAWSAGCALSDGGFLLLGRAETLMAHGQCFVPVDLKRRLSRKSTRGAHLS